MVLVSVVERAEYMIRIYLVRSKNQWNINGSSATIYLAINQINLQKKKFIITMPSYGSILYENLRMKFMMVIRWQYTGGIQIKTTISFKKKQGKLSF